MDIRPASISQITAYIKKTFDNNPILNNIWIKGEISNFKHHYSGHMYITLKDEGAVLKAVMFKNANKSLDFEPKDGMKVIVRGRITVYEPSGAYQMYIEEMKQDGVGDLYAAFEKMKKRLEAEGLFEPSHKKPLPKFPEKIGVCTATTGAAVRDIINVITRRFPYAEILIHPTVVQGNEAVPSIVDGINMFNRLDLADVLIVGRGGGSIEDLWAFNEADVAYAIYNSHIPIISAVGHETDFTIADFVADLRAPTPSAAAELAVPSSAELYSKISMMKGNLIKIVERENEKRRLKIKSFAMKSPIDRINSCYLKTDNMVKTMENRVKVKIMNSKNSFSKTVGALDALSPLSVMSRGFSVATDGTGKIIRSVKDLKKEFNLRLTDGTKKCVPIDKE